MLKAIFELEKVKKKWSSDQLQKLPQMKKNEEREEERKKM
jgi:hypothetical protein